MNKQNFQTLIDAIELNGAVNFNMATFYGLKKEQDFIDGFPNLEMPMYASELDVTGINSSYLADYINSNSGQMLITTSAFDCNTAGCIAGFAAACANDWKLPKFVVGNESYFNWTHDFENVACDYLGITITEGRKIFYNSDDCIWKWGWVNGLWPHLKMISEDYGSEWEPDDPGLSIDELYNGWDSSEYLIHFKSIDYKTAAEALRMIMNEEIILCDSNCNGETTFGPNYKKVRSY